MGEPGLSFGYPVTSLPDFRGGLTASYTFVSSGSPAFCGTAKVRWPVRLRLRTKKILRYTFPRPSISIAFVRRIESRQIVHLSTETPSLHSVARHDCRSASRVISLSPVIHRLHHMHDNAGHFVLMPPSMASSVSR